MALVGFADTARVRLGCWLFAVLAIHLHLSCWQLGRSGCRVLLAPQNLFQGISHGQEGTFSLPVVDVAAASLRLDESCFPKDSQVLGHSPLRDAQARRNRPHAQGLLLEQAQDLDTRADGDGLETASQNLHLLPHNEVPQDISEHEYTNGWATQRQSAAMTASLGRPFAHECGTPS
jgi:hypothetical protein